MKYSCSLLMLSLSLTWCLAQSQEISETQDIDEFTKSMQKQSGFFDFYWDVKTGKIWLEIKQLDEEFLYVTSLPAGIGSNDIGLDRGQLGGERVVKFIRSGPKIMLVQVNYQYRALSDNPAERMSVEQAFAQSIIGGFLVIAETEGRVLVDVTDFLLRDAHGYSLGPAHSITRRLRETNQGIYRLDKNRSAVYLERTINFPENTEFEVTLTFGLNDNEKEYGSWAASVVPSAESITIRQHHTFIKLPDDGYQMRELDPRSGYHGMSFYDYATPIDQPLVKHFIHRHRLEKKDPSEAISEAVEPIVYYLDPGAPEPIRSALIEGASWWNQAFEAAGYKNAFLVKVLPENVDPMDVRYNVIQWVHRSTRGWSYGMTVSDPRTGEIIKGHVSLGSLRVRQDFLIAQGLVQAYVEGKEQDPRMLEMALARLRQLSAHEVGHTLGLLHNYAASTNDRASVMDYPHPYIILDKNGNPDFSGAYDDKIGIWDQRAILYGYQDFPEGTDEAQSLLKIIQENIDSGLRYITDRDARAMGGAHPQAHLWDNGENPVEEMERLISLRKVALQQFGENNIPPGAAWSTLEEVLVPLYLAHRYQTEAVSKLIAGLDYTYAHRGDGQEIVQTIDKKRQLEALEALLYTLDPDVLAIPAHIRLLIPPKAPNYQRGRESFKTRTGVTFDPIAAAEGAANLGIALLLNPQRATRLTQQKIMDHGQLGLDEVIDLLVQKTWKTSVKDPYYQEIQRLTGQLTLQHLMRLALNDTASFQACAIANLKILTLESWLRQQMSSSVAENQRAHYQYGLTQIGQFKSDPESLDLIPALSMPDGSPIGSEFGCSF